MSPDPKLATLIAGTETLGSKDRGANPGAGILLSQWDAGYADGRSAPPSGRISDTLTVREREVLAMISQGSSNKQIARALEISPETVKSHVKRIFLKLTVSTRTAAVFRAALLGLCRQGRAPQVDAKDVRPPFAGR
jgi:LuxR family maltose regulon positive regulatory protein